jgi:hypothetical protein
MPWPLPLGTYVLGLSLSGGSAFERNHEVGRSEPAWLSGTATQRGSGLACHITALAPICATEPKSGLYAELTRLESFSPT